MQYLVFGGVWLGLLLLGFVVVGASSVRNLKRLNREGELHPKATHQIQYENNLQLFVITVLLAGILAVLVATLLVR